MRKDFVDISVFQMYNNTNRAQERRKRERDRENGKIRDSGEISARLTFQFFKSNETKWNKIKNKQLRKFFFSSLDNIFDDFNKKRKIYSTAFDDVFLESYNWQINQYVRNETMKQSKTSVTMNDVYMRRKVNENFQHHFVKLIVSCHKREKWK